MLKTHRAIIKNIVLNLVYPQCKMLVYCLSVKSRSIFLPGSLKLGHLSNIALLFQKIWYLKFHLNIFDLVLLFSVLQVTSEVTIMDRKLEA